MNWTTLIAEYFLIGLQTVLCITLAVLAIDSTACDVVWQWVNKDTTARTAVLTTFAVAYIYPIGMLMDKVWHILFRKMFKSRTLQLWNDQEDGEEERAPRAEVGHLVRDAERQIYGEAGMAARLLRRRSRFRIFRALMVNLPLSCLAIYVHYKALWLIALATVGLVVTILVYRDIHVEYVVMCRAKGDKHL